VTGKHRAFEPALQQVLSIATKLAVTLPQAWAPETGAIVALEPEDIRVTFSDGLPPDRLEDIQEQELLLTMQVQSRRAAIELLYGMDEESADELLAEIDADGASQSVAPPGNPLGLTLGPAFEAVPPAGEE
jgi:hypothetical protein